MYVLMVHTTDTCRIYYASISGVLPLDITTSQGWKLAFYRPNPHAVTCCRFFWCTCNLESHLFVTSFKFDLFIIFSLDALDPNAYEAFQASNNLTDVVQRCLQKRDTKAGIVPGMSKKLSIKASLMTPVKPMLV